MSIESIQSQLCDLYRERMSNRAERDEAQRRGDGASVMRLRVALTGINRKVDEAEAELRTEQARVEASELYS